MQTKPTNSILPAKLAALGAALRALIFACASGADATLAGVGGENTCAACHSGSGGAGSVRFPNGTTYTPGVTQHLVAQVSGIASPSNVYLSVQR
jgi:hypothetical protein